MYEPSTPIADASCVDRLARIVADAPPLTSYQRYVLTVAFADKLDTWLREDQWIAMMPEEPGR